MTEKTSKTNIAQNEILITPPGKGEEISLNQVISTAAEGSLIRLANGEYPINETIKLTKSIRLIGEGIDKTIITGSGLELLLESASHHNIELEGISFITKSEKPTTAVKIDGGVLKVMTCAFSGGIGERVGKLGTGLYIGGNAEVEISQSRFEDNQESGLWLDGKTHGVVVKNEFRKNDSGLAVTGDAPIDAIENYFTENHVGVAYDQSSTGQIRGNSFIENRGGVLVKGNSTASIINNKFAKNDIGIALAESCDVLIKENAINDGEWGIKVINNSVALIDNNTIQGSSTGIGCLDQSNTKIYNNNLLRNTNLGIIIRNDSITHIEANTISDNQFGIELNHDVNFRIEKNHIVGNSKYGMYTRRQAKGIVHNNIIKKNGEGGVLILDDSDVDFDNYQEPVAPGNPVSYSEDNSQITISTPNNSERVFFKDLLAKIQPETEIVFAVGEYNLSDPIIIDKPIKMIAKTIGEVRLIGDGLSNLLVFEGQGKLSLIGIAFSLESQNQTNVIVIKSGDLEMDQCTIEGGKDPQTSKRDFGAGLILLGTSTATVSNSIFKKNILGVSAQDKSAVTLVSNKFTENAYGIVFRDKSNCHSRENECYSNTGYGLMAYDESELNIVRDTCHNNKAGFGFINHSKATIHEAKSFENEYHGFFIDNDSDCVLKNNQSNSNAMSGIAIYGDSQTLLEENEVYENSNHGLEIAENAKSTLRNNKIHENSSGIFLGNTAIVNIERNEIYENGIGISIDDEATATIENNKVYQNSGEAIDDSSEKESTIGTNEMFDNGEENRGDDNEDDNDDDDSGGLSLGDLFAKMLGSENLSNDPNVIAIPLGDKIGTGGSDDDDDEVVSMDQINSFLSSMTNDPVQSYYSLVSDGDNFLESGEVENAIETYKKAVEKNPNDPTAYVKLGHVSAGTNDISGAVDYLKKAIDVEKYHRNLCLLRGSLLELMGKTDDASSDFLMAIRANLDDSFDRSILSRSHAENNQMCIAVEAFARNIDFEVTDASSALIKGVLNIIVSSATFFDKGEGYEEPIDLFTKAIQLEPGKVASYWCRGFVQKTYKRKIDDFSKAIQLMGENAESYYIRGYTKLLESDIEGARQDFSMANELEPGNIEPYIKLGLYYTYKLKDYSKASDVFTTAIEHDQHNPNLHYYRGIAYEKHGKIDIAISDFKQYIDLINNGGEFQIEKIKEKIEILSKGGNSDSVDASVNNDGSIDIGKIFTALSAKRNEDTQIGEAEDEDNEKEDLEEATGEYGKAIKLGIEFSKKGDQENACAAFTKAIDIEPEKAAAYIYRSSVHDLLGLKTAVIDDLTKAIEITGFFVDTIYILRGSQLQLNGNLNAAIDDYLKAIQIKLNNEFDFIVWQLFGYSQENLSPAINFFVKNIHVDELNASGYFMRGISALLHKKSKIAIRFFTKAIEIDPENPGYYWCRGFAFSDINAEKESLSDFSEAIKNKSDKAGYYFIRGYAKLILFEYSGAREDFDIADQLEPGNYEPYEKLGILLAMDKQYDLAIENLSKAISIDNERSDALYYRGICLQAKKDEKGALADFKKIIEINGVNGNMDMDEVQNYIEDLSN